MGQTRFDLAVETFQNSSGMSEGEAKVYVLRTLNGRSRSETADQLDKSEGTVDTQYQTAKAKARLPEVSQIDLHTTVAAMEDKAVIIWFENGAKLQYRVHEHDGGGTSVYEETAAADNPDCIVESVQSAISAEGIRGAALESLAKYINKYRDDPDACRQDWPHIFEATTLYSA